jgi:tellurium resistance protein TerD
MTFNLEKGSKFAIDKGIKNILIGLGWDESATSKPVDVDAHVFGCILNAAGNPTFYNDGSHAVTYANGGLQKNPNKSFQTKDGSIIHTGDNRTGAGAGDDESISIKIDLLPSEIVELSVFLTIHEAKARGQNFGIVKNSYVRLVDQDSGAEICRYDLANEFQDAITIQVGSLVNNGGTWSFKAVGAGTANEGLGEILEKLG